MSPLEGSRLRQKQLFYHSFYSFFALSFFTSKRFLKHRLSGVFHTDCYSHFVFCRLFSVVARTFPPDVVLEEFLRGARGTEEVITHVHEHLLEDVHVLCPILPSDGSPAPLRPGPLSGDITFFLDSTEEKEIHFYSSSVAKKRLHSLLTLNAAQVLIPRFLEGEIYEVNLNYDNSYCFKTFTEKKRNECTVF